MFSVVYLLVKLSAPIAAATEVIGSVLSGSCALVRLSCLPVVLCYMLTISDGWI